MALIKEVVVASDQEEAVDTEVVALIKEVASDKEATDSKDLAEAAAKAD